MSSPDYKTSTKVFLKKQLVDNVVDANKKIKRGALDSWRECIKEALEISNKLFILNDNLCATDVSDDIINPAHLGEVIEAEGSPSLETVSCSSIEEIINGSFDKKEFNSAFDTGVFGIA